MQSQVHSLTFLSFPFPGTHTPLSLFIPTRIHHTIFMQQPHIKKQLLFLQA